MTKVGLFYYDMRKLLKNKKNAHIMVNYSLSTIPQVEKNYKQYTTHKIKSYDRARQFQQITDQ